MQKAQQLKVYTIYYRDFAGRKYSVNTKPCTKAQALMGWHDLNSLNTFIKTRMVAWG